MAVAGVVLLVIGLLVAISEAHNPTHGIAGTAGVAVMAVGIALALTGVGAGVAIGLGAAAVLAAAGGGGLALTASRASQVRRQRVRGGAEGLIGQIGVVRSWAEQDGRVVLQGGVWQARRSPAPDPEEDAPPPELHPGDRVVVERLSGLTVSVRPAEEWELL